MPFDSQIGPAKLYSPAAPGRPWRITWSPPGMEGKKIASELFPVLIAEQEHFGDPLDLKAIYPEL